MDSKKRKKLETKGWVVGDTGEFLQLTAEEARYIELKLATIIAQAEPSDRPHND